MQGGEPPPAQVRARVRGRVQGVWFRASTRARARELGLAGWVRNCDDGSVELLAEGPRADLERLLAWARQGPELAEVSALEASWGDATGELPAFEIRRT